MNCPACGEPVPQGADACGCGRPIPRGPTFIGRERELAELGAGVEAALAGRGRLYLLGGEPGIGKTRTADEVTGNARSRGMLPLWGRCWEGDGAPAYWPWVQAIRAYVQERPAADLLADMGRGAADIARVVPEVRDQLPDLPPPPALEPEEARFRLFDSITVFLQGAATRQPLLLVLDDLQWADTPSLLLLRFLAREIGAARLLIVCTYRDVEVTRAHPLRAALGELAAKPVTRRLFLGGLTEAEVGRYIEMATGLRPAPALVEAVARRTEGNPFFVGEIVRLLAAEGRLELGIRTGAPLPEGVREVIERRLEGLSPECLAVLRTAAVVGRDFGQDVLEAVGGGPGTGLGRERVLAAVEEGLAARVIAEAPRDVGRYSFAHALVRETLYGELPATRRTELHRRIGEVLEALHGETSERHLTALAHHFVEAACAGTGLAKAVTYSRRAGVQALALLAYEEAVGHFERALEALGRQPARDDRQHADLLLALSEARLRADDAAGARDAATQAAELAQRCGAPEQLARAALAFGEGVWITPDEKLVRLLDRARAALPPGDSALQARVLARLASAQSFTSTPEERRAWSGEAVEMARRVGDPATLASALRAHHLALRSSGDLAERLAVAGEMIRLAEVTGDREVALHGQDCRVVDLFELGETRAVDQQIEANVALAEELRQPRYAWYAAACKGLRASMDGRFADAERLAEQALAVGERVQQWEAAAAFGGIFYTVRVLQGRFAELVDPVRSYVEQYPQLAAWRAALAYVEAEAGHAAEARRGIEAFAGGDVASLPRDTTRLATGAFVALAVAALGEATQAAALYDALLPYADRNVAICPALCLGPTARYLGLLAATMERWPEAEVHFASALASNARMGARPWVATTQADLVAMLCARDAPGDRARAGALAAEAHATAAALGMTALAERTARLADGAAPSQPVRGPAGREAASAVADDVFRREGEYWTIRHAGHVCRLRDSKGLRYLAQLLCRPGEELHVLVIVAETEGQPTEAHGGGGDAGAHLDAPALAAYRQRLRDLEGELDEAEGDQDAGRTERARQEMEFLQQELARALGLQGRGRRAASASERARQSVSRALKTALERIAASHPALGRHLATTVRTGTFCSYTPDPRAPIAWAS